MVDAVLVSLHDVALMLIPTLGAICLVLLIMILYRVYKVVRDLPATIHKVDDVIDSTKKSVDLLDAPLNTLGNVSKTVDKVNDSAVSAVNKSMNFAVDMFKNYAEKKANKEEIYETDEEDFGVYE